MAGTSIIIIPSSIQTGTGSPLNIVTPTQAGATYTDQSTGNIWVALTINSNSWILNPASNLYLSSTLN